MVSDAYPLLPAVRPTGSAEHAQTPLQVRMTRFFPAFRLAAASAALAVSAVSLHAQAPAPMGAPRYQSPGVASPQAQAPTPVVNFPVTTAITPNGTVAEEVIARINDQIITRSDLMRGEEVLQNELAQNAANAGDPAERQRNMLRDLIDQQLLISKAKELGVNADAEVVRQLDEIRKQNNLPNMEALEAAARKQGVSFEDFKSNIRNQVLTRSVVRDEVGRNIRMTKGGEQKYYDEHKDQFSQPEQVRLSEILIPTPANATDADLATAQAKAEDTEKKLKDGADFAATAKAVSGGPTAAQGGDLGVFRRGQLAKVLEDKTFVLPVGGITDPVRTRQGFVILKAVDRVNAGVQPFEKVEGDVQNAMYQEEINPALRAYLTKLREDSYVDIKPGFVDTGASAKQAKPVFASYVAPAPKKKTILKRRLDAEKQNARLQKAGLAAKGNTVQKLAPAELDKHGKPKKVHREKVRFGQAPTNALPEAPSDDTGVEVATGHVVRQGASSSGQDALGTSATNPALAGTAAEVAPGTQLAPVGTGNTVAANTPDEATEEVAPRKKTRFADKEPEIKVKKQDKITAKAIDKVTSKPTGPSTTEKQTAAVQSTALGLNGDTGKKKKKRAKGEAKQRLQETTPEAKPTLVDNGLPDRLHQQNGPQQTTGTPSASSQTGSLPNENSKQDEKERRGKEPVTMDDTTLPPADQAAPGTTLPSQTPSTNGTVTPNSSSPLPDTNKQPQ